MLNILFKLKRGVQLNTSINISIEKVVATFY